MPKFDTLLMHAHIAIVIDEYPDGDPVIVRGLYDRFVDCQGRQPTLDEFRDYFFGITSTFEWLTLRQLFDAHEPTLEELEAYEDLAVPVAHRPRRPGRPGWTAQLFWARYRAACAQTKSPLSFRCIAQHFEALNGDLGIDPDHLRKLARRFGPPPE